MNCVAACGSGQDQAAGEQAAERLAGEADMVNGIRATSDLARSDAARASISTTKWSCTGAGNIRIGLRGNAGGAAGGAAAARASAAIARICALAFAFVAIRIAFRRPLYLLKYPG